LPDAGRLQEEDADYRNRHNLTKHNPALPLYTEKDAFAALELLEPVANTGEALSVAPGIRAASGSRAHSRIESRVVGSGPRSG
jgi:metallo-beta-lactamase family protein